MSQPPRCPHCGAALGSDGSDSSLCSRCLMQLAVAGPSAAQDASPAGPLSGRTAGGPSDGPAAEPIAGYRILRKLGEGGMGEVYEGEQQWPVRRRVALKLIKWGMDTRQVVARFESERQALARMSHPNVARVFDAGATELGRPYFAMEYVSGEPIVAYCDRHRFSVRERLELFIGVCRGVQHAHQKGIIHRDIKSSNVLVTVEDDEPVPKIIDFGVAKATEQRLTEQTLFTATGMLVGTPEYMSPEQAGMTGADIDTRTDVYSLGVLLYELLTGTLPFDPRELREAGFDEIRRRIREDDPPKPSTRLSALGDASTESARRRRVDLPTLRRELRGDLDWITMKALAKDRARRYGSPNELADDVRRHLDHQPVVAGPPSAAYRAGKFVRRHRIGVGFSAVLVLLLVVLATSMTVQARRTARERDRANEEAATAEQVSEFLVGLFEVSDPDEARGRTVTAEEILDRGAERIAEELQDQPVVRARLMQTMGRVYRNIGSYEQAAALLEQALGVQREVLGPDHGETLETVGGLAWLNIKRGRIREAEPLYRELMEARRRALGGDHPSTLAATSALGNACRLLGRYDEAESLLLEALEGQRRSRDPDDTGLPSTMMQLATVYLSTGRYDEAEPLFLEAQEELTHLLGDDHPRSQAARLQTALLYRRQGRFEEAESLIARVLETRRRVLGEEHSDTLHTATMLALVYRNQGRDDQAEPLLLETLEALQRTVGPNHQNTFTALLNLAALCEEQGRLDESAKRYNEALDSMRAVIGGEHPVTLVHESDLGRVYMRQNEFGKAESVFSAVAEKRSAVLGAADQRTLASLYELARALAAQGKRTGAIDALRRAVEGGYEFEAGPDELRDDPYLGVLRGDPEFEALVAGL